MTKSENDKTITNEKRANDKISRCNEEALIKQTQSNDKKQIATEAMTK